MHHMFRTLTHALLSIGCAAAALLIPAFISYAQDGIPAAEREVLLELFRRTDGKNWTEHEGWNGEPGTEYEWSGIGCDEKLQHVESLILSNRGLNGSLPPNLNRLTELRTLSLEHNQLRGSMPALSGLRGLVLIDVSDNRLSGRIPDLSSLKSLSSVDFSNNQFSGPLPGFKGLAALGFFRASSNRLSGPIPPMQPAQELRLLDLASNQLSGSLPELSGMPLLHDVFLSDNRLGGPIPPLHHLPQLMYLRLDHNRFSGPLPSLKALSNLQEINVGYNRLNGALPMPPADLKNAFLCPNRFSHPSAEAGIDAAWNRITKKTPWWRDCSTAGD